MPEEQQNQSSSQDYASDLNVKLRDIEEKQNLIKDRILLIGENLIEEKRETEKEVIDLKHKQKEIEIDIKKIKLAVQRIIESQEEFIRKSEFQILERQFKMFQPLELARISDVEEMINQALKKVK